MDVLDALGRLAGPARGVVAVDLWVGAVRLERQPVVRPVAGGELEAMRRLGGPASVLPASPTAAISSRLASWLVATGLEAQVAGPGVRATFISQQTIAK